MVTHLLHSTKVPRPVERADAPLGSVDAQALQRLRLQAAQQREQDAVVEHALAVVRHEQRHTGQP